MFLLMIISFGAMIFFIAQEVPLGIIISALITMTIIPGFMIINPNEARVMIFFGKYVGSIKENGFFWANPFIQKKSISLRARNLNFKTIDSSKTPAVYNKGIKTARTKLEYFEIFISRSKKKVRGKGLASR